MGPKDTDGDISFIVEHFIKFEMSVLGVYSWPNFNKPEQGEGQSS